MLTCKSPRKVMLVAHHLAKRVLPDRTSKFGRHDFTLPQLFACLVLKEQQKRSYREAEALLRDAEHWFHAIGIRRVPDHSTLCRAAILRRCRAGKLLDAVVRFAAHSQPPGRRHMRRLLRTPRSRRACGYTQRWQAETVVSMLKRNLGSALRGKTTNSRKRDLWLKVLTRYLMILRRPQRVETEQVNAFQLRFFSFSHSTANQSSSSLRAAEMR